MKEPLRRHPLLTAVVFTVIGVLPLYLTAAQTVAVQRDLQFGPGRFGLVVSAFFLVSSVASKRVGPRIDREGPRRALRIAMALTVLTCTLVTFGVRDWRTLAVATAIAGLANAYGQVGSNVIIARIVRQHRHAVSFSAKQSAVPLSAMISGIVVPVLGSAGNWRVPYLVVGGLAALLFVSVPDFTDSAVPPDARGTVPRRGATPALVALMASVALAGGIGNSVAAFASDAAVDAGFSVTNAALLLTAGSLIAIVVRISAGLNADRRAGTGFLETTVLIGLGIFGLVVLSWPGASQGRFLLGLMLTFAGAWGWQGVVSFMVLRTIDLPAATSTGAVWAGIYLGTVIAPSVVGVAVEQTSYATVFAGQAVAMVVALACVAASRRLSRDDRQRIARSGPS